MKPSQTPTRDLVTLDTLEFDKFHLTISFEIAEKSYRTIGNTDQEVLLECFSVLTIKRPLEKPVVSP